MQKFDPPAVRTHKTCPKCRRRLPLSAFNRSRQMPDGRYSWCRECANAARGKRRRRSPDKPKPTRVTPEAREAIEQSPQRKVCKGCGARKLLRLFPVVPRASGKPATAARCRACMVLRVAAYRRKVKEQATHRPRRARR